MNQLVIVSLNVWIEFGEAACLIYHALMHIKCMFPALKLEILESTLSWKSCILVHSGIRSLPSAPLSDNLNPVW